tara:strand:+ start:965 stop:2236 length:1272 start_codon:yes stop_codon:yes gene_type:complete
MNYDINRPWLTLDPWQKQYIETDPNQDCFLLCGRQVGKTTAMSIKAVELCVKHFKKGDMILINSITEKQAYHMLAKALAYAKAQYPKDLITKGRDKPTKHKMLFKNGTGILCYAAGESGEGLRGFTIKKLMSDEGSRMNDEYFIAVSPMMSVTGGSMDIASTPCGKQGFFYKASLDDRFQKFYVSAEDCPRHTEEFLQTQKERLSKLAYAQEYLAVFTDELRRLFSADLLKMICVGKRPLTKNKGKYYLGVDIAGFGEDECTFELLLKNEDKTLVQIDNIVEKRNFTTDTTRRILDLNMAYTEIKKIGVDDGGIGFGVFSELMNDDNAKKKTIALNNSSRDVDHKGERSKKLLKEDMYFKLLSLMENKQIILLDDDELIASLSSIQMDEGKIFGSYSHIAEGLVRSVWAATKDKSLNIFIHSF